MPTSRKGFGRRLYGRWQRRWSATAVSVVLEALRVMVMAVCWSVRDDKHRQLNRAGRPRRAVLRPIAIYRFGDWLHLGECCETKPRPQIEHAISRRGGRRLTARQRRARNLRTTDGRTVGRAGTQGRCGARAAVALEAPYQRAAAAAARASLNRVARSGQTGRPAGVRALATSDVYDEAAIFHGRVWPTRLVKMRLRGSHNTSCRRGELRQKRQCRSGGWTP